MCSLNNRGEISCFFFFFFVTFIFIYFNLNALLTHIQIGERVAEI